MGIYFTNGGIIIIVVNNNVCQDIYKYKKSFLLNEGGYRDGKL